MPNIPGREITIEGNSTEKHCTAATKKSPRIKMGLEKVEEEIAQPYVESVQLQKRKKAKKK